MKRLMPFALTVLILMTVLTGCASESMISDSDKQTVILYKTPTCGCCGEWGKYMENQGYDVRIEMVPDLDPIKTEYGIPSHLESCHTAVIADYFFEGHIPIEVIEKVLIEKPNISGISLPRMPSGSPGMPGTKRGQWTVYAIKDGEVSEYLKV
ncbi:MAG: DUF411 domain-containing protein [archaeon]